MPTKIFITGVTGYIGGDVLYWLHKNHPDFEYSTLVRSQENADKVLAQYPDIHIVLGDLDDSEKIEKEASWADIVVHTADASDHVNAAKAIAKGLVEGHHPSRPGYWLHTGGTGILTYLDSDVYKTEGEPSEKVFDDWDGVSELVNLPPEAFHRNVDEIVLKAGTEHAGSVKTAIVCPPTIYGKGRGPGSTRSRQAYELAKFILTEGYVPRVGRGLARWNNVHVYDVSRLFDALVNAAVDPARADDGELWGGKGYYLCENGEHIWGELAEFIGREALEQGYLKKAPSVKEMSVEEAAKSPAGFNAASWGLNSRGTAHRARRLLGWEPTERSIWDEVPDMVRSEAALLGQQRTG